MAELTQEYLLSLFTYRDGNLFWKASRSGIKIGDLAGNIRKDGYRQIRINGRLYFAHRLIFLYHHEYLPKYLDHVDGDRLNNDINNLRYATNQENCMNQKKIKFINGKPTSSKFKGVSWHKLAKKWRSRITIDGKLKHLGLFTNEIEAAKCYNRAAIKLFGEYANLNTIPTPKPL